MKSVFVFVIIYLPCVAYSHDAEIHATRISNKEYVTIAVDAKFVPRTNGHPKSTPSISDFGSGGFFENACFTGWLSDAKELVEALVVAENTTDTWAELQNLSVGKKYQITVVVTIADRDGESTDAYTFKPCPPQFFLESQVHALTH